MPKRFEQNFVNLISLKLMGRIMQKHILYTSWQSPCGQMTIGAVDDQLVMSDWTNGWHHDAIVKRFNRLLGLEWVEGESPVIKSAISQLQEYFDGKRRCFDLPLRLIGTPFQIAVWKALEKIPYGQLCSYGDIARAVNNQKAVRAVGGAVGQNPFSIIIPCHRVVGSDKSLTGYGGGYDAKKFLLELENPQTELFAF